MNYFKDKITIVTGGASGMGRAICEQMGQLGATLVVTDIDYDGAIKVADSINAGGGKAVAAKLDVTQQEEVENIINETAREHGRLDLIFNNAGVSILGDERDKTLEHWKKIVNINLFGVIYGTKAAYALMVKQGFGHIVNMSSMGGYIPSPTDVAYGTTKFAVLGLSKSLRVEGEALGVKVSAICPGMIRTPIIYNTPMLNVSDTPPTREEIDENIPAFIFYDVNKAGKAILKGVARNKEMIIFPFHARFAWWMSRLFPAIFRVIGRLQVKGFRKMRLGDPENPDTQ
ncbi:MAG: SDR family oxidoreductase [Deltaproteobacteria bacterium]|nr:SDR family oxidoreductase [Deltaproteobacteria bacterium]